MSSCRSGPAGGAAGGRKSLVTSYAIVRLNWVGGWRPHDGSSSNTHKHTTSQRSGETHLAPRQAGTLFLLPHPAATPVYGHIARGAVLLNRVTCQKKHRPRQEWARYKRVNNNKAKTNKSATKAKDEKRKKRKQRGGSKGVKQGSLMNGTRCQTIFQFELPESESPLPLPLPLLPSPFSKNWRHFVLELQSIAATCNLLPEWVHLNRPVNLSL